MTSITCTGLLAIAGGLASSATRAAADGTWTPPGSTAVCSGGNLSGPTIGAWLAANEPATYAALGAAQQLVLNDVYQGTTCTSTLSSTASLPAVDGTAGIGPSVTGSYSSATPSSCPAASDLGTASNPGCIGAETTLNTAYDFGGFGFNAQDIFYANVYLPGDSVTWGSPSGTNYHDNHGNSWGMSISGFTTTTSDHTMYANEASGYGTYVWFDPNPQTAGENFATEEVHIGYQSTATQHYNGITPTNTVCWFTDYSAWNASEFNGGWCANP